MHDGGGYSLLGGRGGGEASIRRAGLTALRFSKALCYMVAMKLLRTAALALVAWLMMPPLLRAAGGAIVVPGTADVETWYLMAPAIPVAPYNPRGFHDDMARTLMYGPLPAQPLRGWTIAETLPSLSECEVQLHANPKDRCISADDPRLKKK
jgi:hypothetical protein